MNKEKKPKNALDRGAKIISGYVKNLPKTPGVYRMLNESGDVLYVGKAKALKNRVVSYTRVDSLPIRTQRMISQTTKMEFAHTHTEAEALLLEANMIRRLKPRYNVLLRDDKSVPYIFLSGDHDFPQITTHRGKKKRKGDYYGPFASAGPVHETIATLQKVFQIRNCSDSYFENRKRPCLQFHIKRCTAPCVGKVSKEDYATQVKQAKQFLAGKTVGIQKDLAKKMQQASDLQDYEAAMVFRDRIKALTAIQSRQDINAERFVKDADVIAAYLAGGQACIQVFFFRGGRNYGNKAYFPRHDRQAELSEIISAFIGQFYQSRPAAKEVLLSHVLSDADILGEALSVDNPYRVDVSTPQRGGRKRLMNQAIENAKTAHARHLADTRRQKELLEKLSNIFDLEDMPERIEVYDNSHISGTNSVGAMIVAGVDGFEKKHYRLFNIKEKIEPGDDYAMMREVFKRRFTRAQKEGDSHQWPDLVLIDGGKGQLSAATEIMTELGLDHVPLVGVSKGLDRNAGREQFHMNGRDSFTLPMKDPALYFIQRLRDEAHRFAIGSHRAKRSKSLVKSPLDGIPGIGAKRKKALLNHFGSAKEAAGAGVDDLQAVEGISATMAQTIYDYFHGG